MDDDLIIDDDELFDTEAKLSRMLRLGCEVQKTLADADHDTRRELASVVTLLRRVKLRIPATLAAA